jgi:hypothetical protein
MKWILLFSIFVSILSQCLDVNAGSHYPSKFPFDGFRNTTVIAWKTTFQPSAAQYLFPQSEPQGARCQPSWNKLYGGTRCGFTNHIHHDSDRIVWRRAVTCIRFENGRVVGEIENCKDKDMIEVAAYGYDKQRRPYEHPDLLKAFKTLCRIGVEYSFMIRDENTQTRYLLMNATGGLLEEQVILHTKCDVFYRGVYSGLYFGGVCPAPQKVTICYKF